MSVSLTSYPRDTKFTTLRLAGKSLVINSVTITLEERDTNGNVLRCYGTSVPTDGSAGYAPGCIFRKTNGTVATTLYINEGSTTVSDFNAMETAASTVTSVTAGNGLTGGGTEGAVTLNVANTDGNIVVGADSIDFASSPNIAANLTWTKEVNHTVSVSATTTAATVGGSLTLAAGAGNTSGAGGLMSILGGAGGATGTGGAITLTTGAGGATSGASGDLTLATGTTTAGSGSATGAATLQSGAGAASAAAVAGGASGAVTVRSQAGGANTGGATGQIGGASGAVSLSSGNGGATNSTGAHAAGAAGTVSITGGNGGNATAGTGNGGAGASVIQTAGTGGTSTGGTAGVDGGIFRRSATAKGVYFQSMPAPTAKTTNATLTVAEVLGGMITVNQGGVATSTQTTPTGTQLVAACPTALAAGDTFDFVVINISTNAAEDAILAAGTDVTIVGNATVNSNDAIGTQSQGTFRFRYTGGVTWVVYRVS